MPRKLRTPKLRHELTLSEAELERRGKWGGLVPDIPELSDVEFAEWEALKRQRPDWVPQEALRYFWDRADSLHGRGGCYVAGRPRRPDDPGTGDGWRWDRFVDALEADRAEIRDVIAEHPYQGSRLAEWTRTLEALGRERNTDREHRSGYYYEHLVALGYRGAT